MITLIPHHVCRDYDKLWEAKGNESLPAIGREKKKRFINLFIRRVEGACHYQVCTAFPHLETGVSKYITWFFV